MKKIAILLAALVLAGSGVYAKPLRNLKVTVSAAGVARDGAIASLDISVWEIPAGQTARVTAADGSVAVSQVEVCDGKTIVWWRMDGTMTADASRDYTITTAPVAADHTPLMDITVQPRTGNLIITEGGKNVLQYNIALPRLPHGVGREFARNGYIHPAWSPAGNVLTNANPADHAHHYGFWNPWTMIEYDGKTYDLWNIGGMTGTVRYDQTYGTQSGDLYADITVGHRHVIFQEQREQVINTPQQIIRITPKEEVNIMDEVLDMRVWNDGDAGYLWDFVSDLIPATDLPVLLKAYRYAGFGWRATPDWTKENTVMMTSEGLGRQQIDGTNARWIYVTGMSPLGKSGILFLGAPDNQNFPEPLRIWNEEQNGGRGDSFVNFAPTKNVDWSLEPGRKYRLRYRMLMYDGEMTSGKAEAIWKNFATPVTVTIK